MEKWPNSPNGGFDRKKFKKIKKNSVQKSFEQSHQNKTKNKKKCFSNFYCVW